MKKISILIFVIIISITAVFAEQNYPTCGGFSMMSGYYGPGFATLSWITYILVIALIIAGIYWLVKSANKR